MEAIVIGTIGAVICGFVLYCWVTGAEQAESPRSGNRAELESLVAILAEALGRSQPRWVVRVPPHIRLDWWVGAEQLGDFSSGNVVVVFADPAPDEEPVSIYPSSSARAVRAIAAHERARRASAAASSSSSWSRSSA